MSDQDEKQSSPLGELAKKQTKKAIRKGLKKVSKKGAQIAAKLIKLAIKAGIKVVAKLLAMVGLPTLLIIAGLLMLVIVVYMISTMLFSSGEGLEGEAKELAEYIVEASNSTVDMSNPEQYPYRVPEELITSVLQLYDSKDHGKTEKEVIDLIADTLKPNFTYQETKGEMITETTVCTDGGCSTSTSTSDYSWTMLHHIESWDRIVDIEYNLQLLDWNEPSYSSYSTENADGTTSYTSITTRTRWNYPIPTETVTMDYTYFDNMLSDPPFEYSVGDKKMVEALYATTGKEIQYSEWLAGETIVDGGGFSFDGTVTPGEGIPPEFMQYYLAAEAKYGVDWYYLAAFHFIETGFSTHKTMISYVGAEGHMQFMPCTWVGWSYPGCKGGNGGTSIPDSIKHNPAQIKKFGGFGSDGNGNGKASPWEIEDAIMTAAKYLAHNNFAKDRNQAIRAYNHSTEYVNNINNAAARFREGATYATDGAKNVAPGTFIWPVDTYITSGFGYRNIDKAQHHNGYDFGNGQQPTRSIWASAEGEVIKVHSGCPNNGGLNNTCGGQLGNHVNIKHQINGKWYTTTYNHLSKTGVKVGQKVKQGAYIGNMGHSGRSTAPHLHFEIHNGVGRGSPARSTAIDPGLLLSKK